jgi:hypothetical protein
MRSISWLLALLAMAAVPGVASAANGTPAADPREPAGAILRIEVSGDEATVEGTCFLVQKERRDHDVVLYFVSAGHLFDAGALGESRIALLHIRIDADSSNAIDTVGSDVVFPAAAGLGLDLAVVRVVVPDSDLEPVPISLDSPGVGDAFVIAGAHLDPAGVLTGRVRSRTARLVVADRSMPDDRAAGAPALLPSGVFGVISDTSPDGIAVITLLSAARTFLTRAIPGWPPATAVVPSFTIEERRFDGPLMKVGCDAVAAGDVDVPFTLQPREAPIDVTAAFLNPRALRLGDLTVSSLDDRVVKLRFTMAGMGPSPLRPGCPPGQALVSVTMSVVVLPRR